MHRRFWLLRFEFLFASALLSALVSSTTLRAQDDENDMEADSDEVALTYLLKERRVTVAPGGLKTIREHNIIKVLKRSAIDYAGDISFEYSSFYSKARLVKGFTRTSDNRVVEVSSDAIHDTLPRNFQEFKMYSDVRTLGFSMPAVDVDSVLDYEIEQVETQPIIAGHAWDTWHFDEREPVKESRYILEYPAGMNLKFKLSNGVTNPVAGTRDGLQTLTWTFFDIPKIKGEYRMPPVYDVRRTIHFTSIQSWDLIRDWFAGLATPKGRVSPDIEAAVKTIVAGQTTPIEKIRAIYLAMQRDVRYVGVEFGKSAYEPHPAADCYRYRYGDCKDQTILMIAMLKQVGVDAYPALVRPTYFGGLVKETPHPHQFNHVIVYCPQDGFWLDSTTKYHDEKSHPDYLDGAEALIVGLPGRDFVRIPHLDPARDISRTLYQVNLRHDGKTVVKEISEYVGRAGAQERAGAEDLNLDERRKEIEKHMKKSGSDRLIDIGHSNPHDLGQPYQSWITYETDRFLNRTPMGFGVTLSPEPIRWALSMGTESPDGKEEARRYPWQSLSGGQSELVCRIDLPVGFSPVDLPERQEYTLPQGDIVMSASATNRQVELRCLVRGRPALIAPEKWREVKNQTDNALALSSIALTLEDEVRKLLIQGKPRKAEAMVRGWIRENPSSSEFHHRLAGIHHRCGLLVRARQTYRKSIELGNRELAVFEDLAETYGGYSGTYGDGFNREAAATVLREAVDKCSDPRRARYALAALHERNAEGIPDRKLPHVREAIAIYEALAAEDPKDTRPLLALGQCHFSAGDFKTSENHFSRAFELDKRDSEALAGKWTCAAFLGRLDQCMDAIRSAFNDNSMRVSELQRVTARLLIHRRYSEAVTLINQSILLSGNTRMRRDLPAMIQRMAKRPAVDYSTYHDLSTPKGAVISMTAAIYYEDLARLKKCYSPRVRLSESEWEATRMAIRLLAGESFSDMRDYILDMMAGEWTMAETPLDETHVELKLIPPKELGADATARQSAQSCLLRREKDQWRICSAGAGAAGALPLAMIAQSFIEENDFVSARFYGEQLAARATGASADDGPMPSRTRSSPLCDLDREDFSSSTNRTLAYVGAILHNAGVHMSAVSCLRRSAEREPDNLVLQRVLGQAMQRGHMLDLAENTLSRVLARKTSDWRSLALYCETLSQLGRHDQAGAQLARLKDIAPSPQDIALTEIRVLEEAGRYADALKAVQRQRNNLPKILAVVSEASLLSHLGRREDLDKLIDDQQEERFGKSMIHRSFAIAFINMNDLDAAIEQTQCSLFYSPDEADMLLLLARLLFVRGDLEEARSIVDRVAQMPILSPDESISLADEWLVLGRTEEAIRKYDETETYMRADNLLYRDLILGSIHLARGRKDQATALFKRAPSRPYGSCWPLPAAEWANGKISEEAMLQQAEAAPTGVRRGQYVAEAAYYAAMKALADGKRDKAIALFKRAIATHSVLTLEFLLAKAELAALEPPAKTQP